MTNLTTKKGKMLAIALTALSAIPVFSHDSTLAQATVGTSFIDAAARRERWSQLTPTGGLPAARQAPSAVFDSTADQMIVFGGTPGGFDLNDVWALTNLSKSPQWVLRSPTGTPPPPRAGHSAVYDLNNARMTVFGGGLGQSAPCANDVWVLSNANSKNGVPSWAQLAPTGVPPVPRTFHTSVYDPTSNRMIVFGGNNCFTQGAQFYNDVWILTNANGLGGTPAWTQLSPSGGPPAARENHTAVYDPASNRMIIFGGGSTSGLNDVWVLANANGLGGTPTWMQLAPSGAAIPPLAGASAVYNAASDQMTVFAGGDTLTGSDTNAVWVLQNANGLLRRTPSWTQVAPSGALPPVREEHTAVYDPSTNKMVIFGGVTGANPKIYYNDTWVLQGR